MPLILLPFLGGAGLGFLGGSWASGLVGKLFKLGLLGAFVYYVLLKL